MPSRKVVAKTKSPRTLKELRKVTRDLVGFANFGPRIEQKIRSRIGDLVRQGLIYKPQPEKLNEFLLTARREFARYFDFSNSDHRIVFERIMIHLRELIIESKQQAPKQQTKKARFKPERKELPHKFYSRKVLSAVVSLVLQLYAEMNKKKHGYQSRVLALRERILRKIFTAKEAQFVKRVEQMYLHERSLEGRRLHYATERDLASSVINLHDLISESQHAHISLDEARTVLKEEAKDIKEKAEYLLRNLNKRVIGEKVLTGAKGEKIVKKNYFRKLLEHAMNGSVLMQEALDTMFKPDSE